MSSSRSLIKTSRFARTFVTCDLTFKTAQKCLKVCRKPDIFQETRSVLVDLEGRWRRQQTLFFFRFILLIKGSLYVIQVQFKGQQNCLLRHFNIKSQHSPRALSNSSKFRLLFIFQLPSKFGMFLACQRPRRLSVLLPFLWLALPPSVPPLSSLWSQAGQTSTITSQYWGRVGDFPLKGNFTLKQQQFQLWRSLDSLFSAIWFYSITGTFPNF